MRNIEKKIVVLILLFAFGTSFAKIKLIGLHESTTIDPETKIVTIKCNTFFEHLTCAEIDCSVSSLEQLPGEFASISELIEGKVEGVGTHSESETIISYQIDFE